jgi:hypothetical protein
MSKKTYFVKVRYEIEASDILEAERIAREINPRGTMAIGNTPDEEVK